MSGHALYMQNEVHVDQYLDSRSNFKIQHESYSSGESKEDQVSGIARHSIVEDVGSFHQ